MHTQKYTAHIILAAPVDGFGVVAERGVEGGLLSV